MNDISPSTAQRTTGIWRPLAVFFLYGLAAFAVLHVFMLHNGWFREVRGPGFSFDRMVSCTADRPFAYRVLLPVLINAGAALFPEEFANSHATWLTKTSPLVAYARTTLYLQPGLALKVHVAWVLQFVSLVGLLYCMRLLTRHFYRFPPGFSDTVPALALLLLPVTFSWGGHLYDLPELALMGLCLVCIVKKSWVAYYPAFALAVANKEIDVLVVLFFVALTRDSMPAKDLAKHVALQVVIGSGLVLGLRYLCAANPMYPGAAEGYLSHNIKFWLNPLSYFLFWDAYHVGLRFVPRGSNIVLLSLTAFFACYRWRDKPREVRRMLGYAAIFTIPLFLYAGWADEIRTLSLLFPGLYLLGCHTLHCLLEHLLLQRR